MIKVITGRYYYVDYPGSCIITAYHNDVELGRIPMYLGSTSFNKEGYVVFYIRYDDTDLSLNVSDIYFRVHALNKILIQFTIKNVEILDDQ